MCKEFLGQLITDNTTVCPSLKQFSLMRFQIKQFFTTLKMQYLQEFFVKVGCVWCFKKYFDPIMRGILYMTSWQWQYSLLYLLRLFTRPFSEEKKDFQRLLQYTAVSFSTIYSHREILSYQQFVGD